MKTQGIKIHGIQLKQHQERNVKCQMHASEDRNLQIIEGQFENPREQDKRNAKQQNKEYNKDKMKNQ